MTTQAAETVDRTGQTKTETRYWECSVCKHQEWAAPGDYMYSRPNPPPMLGHTWRYKDRVDAAYCLCQKRTDEEHKDKKIHEYAARTMKLYKATVWLKEGESLPNVGIKVSLLDQLQGKDPAEEKALGDAADPQSAVPQILQPQGLSRREQVIEPSEAVEADDPAKLFGKEKG